MASAEGHELTYLEKCNLIAKKLQEAETEKYNAALDKYEKQAILEATENGTSKKILPRKMGVKPGPDDIRNGFAHPSFGPPPGTFWMADDFQDFFVMSVSSPSLFHVQNLGQKSELKDLEEEMTEFYDKYWKTSRTIVKEDLVLGGFYAAYSERFETWNRCRVEDLNEGTEEITVELLDYGTRDIVKLDCILPLRPEYLELQAQVCSASLYDDKERDANVKVDWTPEQKKQFTQAIGGQVIHTYIMKAMQYPKEAFQHLEVAILNTDDDGNDSIFVLESQ